MDVNSLLAGVGGRAALRVPRIVTNTLATPAQIGTVITVAGWPATVITNLATASLLAAALAVYQTFPSLLSVIQLPPTVRVPFRPYA